MKKKKNKNNMVVKDIKISQKMKNRNKLNIEENIMNGERTPYYNYNELFSYRIIGFFSGLR